MKRTFSYFLLWMLCAAGMGYWGAFGAWAQAEAPTAPLPPGTVQLSITPNASQDFQLLPGTQNIWQTPPWQIQCTSPLRQWTVMCEVSPLTNQAAGAVIAPERIELVSNEAPAARAFTQPLPVLVGGLGTRSGPVGSGTMALRVSLDWTDPPGTYVGTIRFWYLASP